MHILCIFPFFRQGDFVEKARAPLVGYHFLYSHDLYVWLRGDIVRSNETLFSLRGHSSLLEVTGLRGWPPALFLFTSTILTPRWREGLLKEKYLAWQHKTMSPIRTYTFQPQVYEVNVNISLPLISLLQNVPKTNHLHNRSAPFSKYCSFFLKECALFSLYAHKNPFAGHFDGIKKRTDSIASSDGASLFSRFYETWMTSLLLHICIPHNHAFCSLALHQRFALVKSNRSVSTMFFI